MYLAEIMYETYGLIADLDISKICLGWITWEGSIFQKAVCGITDHIEHCTHTSKYVLIYSNIQ